jgi:hypothetical protein
VADARLVPGRTVHLTFDVRIDGDEISGHAGDGAGQPRSFRGWLGLLGALDGLLAAPSTAGGQPSVRVCVAFRTDAEDDAFAASAALRDALRASGASVTPEVWVTSPPEPGRHA